MTVSMDCMTVRCSPSAFILERSALTSTAQQNAFGSLQRTPLSLAVYIPASVAEGLSVMFAFASPAWARGGMPTGPCRPRQSPAEIQA